MKLIIGLGNPGRDYENTRHNLAWYYLDGLDLSWQDKTKFRAEVAEVNYDNEKIIFAKPQTFYNLAGESVRSLMDFYKLSTSSVLVLHDDLALPLGTVRTRLGGSGGGNNGVKSINAHIGSDYARVRLGIASERPVNQSDSDYVLSRFSIAETKIIDQQRAVVTQLIDSFITDSLVASTYKTDPS